MKITLFALIFLTLCLNSFADEQELALRAGQDMQRAVEQLLNIGGDNRCSLSFDEQRSNFCDNFVTKESGFLNELMDDEESQIKDLKDEVHKTFNCSATAVGESEFSDESWVRSIQPFLAGELEACQSDESNSSGGDEHDHNHGFESIEEIQSKKQELQSFMTRVRDNIENNRDPLEGISDTELNEATYLFSIDGRDQSIRITGGQAGNLFNRTLNFDLSVLKLAENGDDENLPVRSQGLLENWERSRTQMITSSNQNRDIVLFELLKEMAPMVMSMQNQSREERENIGRFVQFVFPMELGGSLEDTLSDNGKIMLEAVLDDIIENKGANYLSAFNPILAPLPPTPPVTSGDEPPRRDSEELPSDSEVEQARTIPESFQEPPEGNPPSDSSMMEMPEFVAPNVQRVNGRIVISASENNKDNEVIETDPDLIEYFTEFARDNNNQSANVIKRHIRANINDVLGLIEQEVSVYSQIQADWFEDEEDDHSDDNLTCPNLSPSCNKAYDGFVGNISKTIYAGRFYENAENRANIIKLYDGAKAATSQFINQSSLSDSSKSEINTHLASVNYNIPETTERQAKQSIQDLGEVYSWTKERNSTLAHQDLKSIVNGSLDQIDNYHSAQDHAGQCGLNAYYDPENKLLSMNTGFSSERALSRNKGMMLSIMLHEVGHAIDPQLNPELGERYSSQSQSQRDDLFQCLSDKFPSGQKRVNENYGDLMANEVITSIFSNASPDDDYYLNDLEKRQFMEDNLVNSCRTFTSFSDVHSPPKDRADQFISHPNFREFMPTSSDIGVEHGRDCGEIIR